MGKTQKKRLGKKKKKQSLVKALLLVVILALAVFAYQTLPEILNPIQHGEYIVKVAKENQIDPLLVCAVIKSESNFKTDAISRSGAIGLMQLMPATAEWLCNKQGWEYDKKKLTNPEYNIKLGCSYLSFLLDYWDNDLPKVIASYNAGQSNVVGWLKDGTWDGKAGSFRDIPFKETGEYVNKVVKNYKDYTKLYADDVRFQ